MAAGDITYSNKGGQSNDKAFASGIALADADAILSINLGFIPSGIVLFYKDTAATTKDVKIEWWKGMTAANYWNTVMTDGIMTLVTSGGPTVLGDTSDDTYAHGDDPVYETGSVMGFAIPAGLQDADSDIIYWQAWR